MFIPVRYFYLKEVPKMGTKTGTKIRVLTECSIMIALSVVLSIAKIVSLPYGGSVTAASMLPIVIIAWRHGTPVGLMSATAAGAIQLLLGLNNLSYFTTWYSIIAIILLDYIVAFAVYGLAGIFRGRIKSAPASMLVGALVASALRYICHVISGATVWAGLSIPTKAALLYSFGYNATYMIPETAVLAIAVVYISSVLDFGKPIPTPTARQKLNTPSLILGAVAGFVLLCAFATDAVLVFSKLQNSETGDFMITGLRDVKWAVIAAVTLGAALVSAVLIFISRKLSKKA